MRYYCCCFGTTTEETLEEVHRKGTSAWEQYRTSTTETDKPKSQLLTEAIDFYNQALIRAQSDDTFRPTILISLISALLEKKSPSTQDLALIELHFAEVISKNTARGTTLKRDEGYSITVALGGHYERLYKASSDSNHFDHCLSNYTEAARSYAPNPEEQIQWFLKVAELHLTRAEDSDLEKALNALHAARGLCQDEAYEQRLRISKGTYSAHKKRYTQRKGKADLEAAIAECDYALSLRPPKEDRFELLNEYVQGVWVLMRTHEAGGGNRAKAVARGWEYIDLVVTYWPGNEGKLQRAIFRLANILSWAKANPSVEDLDEAIELYTEAQRWDRQGGSPHLLGKKAAAIRLRCGAKEDWSRLQEAIDLSTTAYEGTDDPSDKRKLALTLGLMYLDKVNNGLKLDTRDIETAREYWWMAAAIGAEDHCRDSFKELGRKISGTISRLRDAGRLKEDSEDRESNHARTRKLIGQRRRSLSRSSRGSIERSGSFAKYDSD
ncbi:hypothetical protein DFP72DRAFT_1167955 [Ephemerocybe angulata]|uniref:Uncharacterized protein n=1 Tax=Ephemerocybe angulata TaxID=980116 RepID=A0A8H6I2P5_9AGAR|nr:hypothetical protein DFP72DRAFT_1167955 [Tulosesus angulatus]